MEKVKTVFENKQIHVDSTKSDVALSKTQVVSKKASTIEEKKKLTREDIPDSIKKLYKNLQTDFSQLFSADELADYLESSRQTILNYASHGILDGQKKVGDKSIYFDFEKSLLPMFLQFENKDFHDDLKSSEINIVCIGSCDELINEYKAAITSRYDKDIVFTLETLTQYGVSLGTESPDILWVANKAKSMIDKEVKKLHDKEKNDYDLKVYELRKKELNEQYDKVYREFLDLLEKTDFEKEKIAVDITDVELALRAIAKTKTLQDISKLEDIERIRYASKIKGIDSKYALRYTDDYGNTQVGTEYEKFFRKAYRIGVGRNIKEGLCKTLSSEHVMLHTYILSGDITEDLMSITKLFRSFKPSYKTIVMGYSVLNDTLKAVVDAYCKGIEEKGSNYSIATA